MTIATKVYMDAASLVLETAAPSIPELITLLRTQGQLSRVVHALNMQLLDGSETERSRAEAALTHLGFV